MTLNSVKLGLTVTFMKYRATVVSLILLANTFLKTYLKQNHVPGIKLAESCRTGGI